MARRTPPGGSGGKHDVWVSLTRQDGNDVWVNVPLVRLIEPDTAGKSRVWFAADHYVVVNGEPHMIAKTLYLGDG
jgi:hypothetical protein